MAKKKTSKSKKAQWVHPWTKRQYMLIGGCVGIIIIGFLMMSVGIDSGWDHPLAVSVAPLVLVITYCVLVPLVIMFGGKSKA